MRHRMLMIAALCTALAATLAQPAVCDWHWQTTQITSDGYTANSHVGSDAVYWLDTRTWQSGYSEVKMWDPVNGIQVQRQIVYGEILAAVYGRKEVMRRYSSATNFDLYLWDPIAGEQAITTAPGNQRNPDMDGQTVVYENYQSGISQIWMWDPVAGARAVSPSTHGQQYPRISGDSVVWQESRTFGRTDVCMWNPREGEKKLSTYIYGMDSPDIYGDTVVMSLRWQSGMYDPYGIWEWKAGQGPVGPLVENMPAYGTRIYGDLLAWTTVDGLGGPGPIAAYYPSTGTLGLAQSGSDVDVYGNRVTWVDGTTHDVWIAELVPEPSSLLALAGGGMCLASLVRRRRTR